MNKENNKEVYKLRLPNGATVEREFERVEVEYWISVGMFLANGFHLMTTLFAAEQMDDEATVQVDDEEEEAPLAN